MKNEELILEDVKVKKNLSVSTRQIYLVFKRFMDIVLSLIGVVFLLVIIIFVKIINVLSGDFKTIFYSHERVGKNGKTFRLYKFRTMVPNSKEMLDEMLKDKKYLKEWKENHKFENDPRVTKVGKILRKTSLDEVPQVLNILKGDMSLIGPRPLIEEEVEAYKKNKSLLLSIKPGLTGWWAVNGRSATTNKKRMELELYYVKNVSLKLDIKIFFMTIIRVLKRDGAK